jgi:hypothetical protein
VPSVLLIAGYVVVIAALAGWVLWSVWERSASRSTGGGVPEPVPA